MGRKDQYNHTKSTPKTTVANIINRGFNVTKPNEKWCADITEIKIPMSNEKVNLSSIKKIILKIKYLIKIS
ncbi:MAG: hypothetical protein RR500_09800 [Bacilli bacterium]